MKRLVLATLAAVAFGVASAAPTWDNGQVHITLKETPCQMPVIATALKAMNDVRTDAMEAVVRFRGTNIRACWVVDGDDDVLVGDEFGTGGVIPRKEFKSPQSL